MKRHLIITLIVATFVALPVIAQANFINTVDVYQVTLGQAISWNQTYDGSAAPEASAFLTIVAEGVDLGEDDDVYFNGHELGDLVQQPFYYSGFDIKAGPGALGYPQTALTTSIFSIDPSWLIVGDNLVQVIAEQNWVMETETSTLQVSSVPEPSLLLLFGAGLAGIGLFRKKSKK